MKKICLNCKHSRQQFKNLVKNMDGSHKYQFDRTWDLAIDDPLMCQNTQGFYRFREVQDDFTCKDFSPNKQREDDVKHGC